MNTLWFVLWLYAAEDISLKIKPQVLFAGGYVTPTIHVVYHESDRWLLLQWNPDIGESTWTVTPSDRQTWVLKPRRLIESGDYIARASVGRGETIRVSAFQRVTVRGE